MNSLAELAKNFFENHSAVDEALRCLKPGVELRLLLDKQELALFFDTGRGRVACLSRAAHAPDLEFELSSESIHRLSQLEGLNLGSFGIEVCREIAAQRAGVKVCGKFLGVLNGGYLTIIRKAGPEFGKFIASKGLNSAGKIAAMIKNLRK